MNQEISPRQPGASLGGVNECDADRPPIAAQRELTARARAYVQIRLTELVANHRDVVAAMAEAYTEQQMGVPYVLMGPLRARAAAYQDAIATLQAELVELDRRYDALCDVP